MTLKITCSKCNSEICASYIEIHFLDEKKYTTCSMCGNVIYEDEIILQAQKHTIELLRGMNFKA